MAQQFKCSDSSCKDIAIDGHAFCDLHLFSNGLLDVDTGRVGRVIQQTEWRPMKIHWQVPKSNVSSR